ncbi:MAG TPA: hypothetical protein IAB44_17170 [Candidatus Limivivens intestinipullorum]|uniref:Uncharacterized protein n=1 Tax=Candidatus Limivivens intestinipullorum TaxID=2840858 RepID=A0A9D1EVX3_9FIRM|nr:hypothetical protein [Candidatus Limivivens intestinipullorum]
MKSFPTFFVRLNTWRSPAERLNTFPDSGINYNYPAAPRLLRWPQENGAVSFAEGGGSAWQNYRHS